MKKQGISAGLKHPQYGPWLEYYTSVDAEKYKTIFDEIINRYGKDVSDEKKRRIKKIIIRASQYDYSCLEMGWNKTAWL